MSGLQSIERSRVVAPHSSSTGLIYRPRPRKSPLIGSHERTFSCDVGIISGIYRRLADRGKSSGVVKIPEKSICTPAE